MPTQEECVKMLPCHVNGKGSGMSLDHSQVPRQSFVTSALSIKAVSMC